MMCCQTVSYISVAIIIKVMYMGHSVQQMLTWPFIVMCTFVHLCSVVGVIKKWTTLIDLGFDKTLTSSQLTPLLTPYRINGKMKIKRAQNYQWDPIRVHQ